MNKIMTIVIVAAGIGLAPIAAGAQERVGDAALGVTLRRPGRRTDRSGRGGRCRLHRRAVHRAQLGAAASPLSRAPHGEPSKQHLPVTQKGEVTQGPSWGQVPFTDLALCIRYGR